MARSSAPPTWHGCHEQHDDTVVDWQAEPFKTLLSFRCLSAPLSLSTRPVHVQGLLTCRRVGPGACVQVDSGRVLGKIPSDKEVAESEALVAEIMSLQVCMRCSLGFEAPLRILTGMPLVRPLWSRTHQQSWAAHGRPVSDVKGLMGVLVCLSPAHVHVTRRQSAMLVASCLPASHPASSGLGYDLAR